MRLAMLSPNAWRTPPRHYGPWERVVSLLTEGLVARGVDVTLFATVDSLTSGKLRGTCQRGYEEDRTLDAKVWECLHISELFDRADDFDLIHNHFDFLPLSYSGLVNTPVVTTIHGFSSPKILPVYQKYNGRGFYVSISEADRSPTLDYISTIHHGIDLDQFTYRPNPGKYLLFFGRIHPDKGTREAIEIARQAGRQLVIAGIIQDQEYYDRWVKPCLDGDRVVYAGSADPEQRDQLLGNAYALLHPINFDEPFGLSVVESMACGTPVVAFSRGSLPELIQDGQNGWLVSDIEEAVEAVKKVNQLDRARCRAIVQERFTVERMVDDYLEVYQRVLEVSQQENRRPWGYYMVLSDASDHKIKRIHVSPGQRLSLQSHQHRSEHWYVVAGEALVTVDERHLRVKPGESIDIPTKSIHRVENRNDEDLVLIEIQRGDYFGEDDIERFEDDFGRARLEYSSKP